MSIDDTTVGTATLSQTLYIVLRNTGVILKPFLPMLHCLRSQSLEDNLGTYLDPQKRNFMPASATVAFLTRFAIIILCRSPSLCWCNSALLSCHCRQLVHQPSSAPLLMHKGRTPQPPVGRRHSLCRRLPATQMHSGDKTQLYIHFISEARNCLNVKLPIFPSNKTLFSFRTKKTV